MVLAFPNHYSFPYRSAYLLKKILLRGYDWPWPHEYKLYDLKEETEAAKLKLIERQTIAKKTLLHFWKFFKPLQVYFYLTGFLFNYQGYLTVLILKKNT
jgi:hypothetical protein